jgi:hypothetical protein
MSTPAFETAMTMNDRACGGSHSSSASPDSAYMGEGRILRAFARDLVSAIDFFDQLNRVEL